MKKTQKTKLTKISDSFRWWFEFEYDPLEGGLRGRPDELPPPPPERPEAPAVRPDPDHETFLMKLFRHSYRIMAVAMCLVIIVTLMFTISYMPPALSADNVYNNEVAERYIEQGLEETGAVNIVAGMILDYRAFDTFGESCVLFTAVCCVFILLKSDRGDGIGVMEDDVLNEHFDDSILHKIAGILVPLILLLGIYVVLNGHLSAGGGFSGGAIMGAGLILYYLAYGRERAERLFSIRTFKIITCSALSFYCLAKSYAFYTGANHLENIISKGTPGAIISSGLILPLNIAVGLIVACTMYSFYVVFRKGGV